ncbi:MAG: HEAT repeat domain-containing protein [Oculatellaceae cyanobacterium Prado106]|jgi:HEAT repeat protein|nr:HEAT repeat domain-containing protein [Oculatellaceae cyanobacterium Prado106]
MSKTLTIELPDDLEPLSVQANALNQPLEKFVLQALNAIATLLQDLQNPNPQIRQAAVEALGAMGTEIAVPTLSQALNDENPRVRQATVDALRKIGTETALSAISQNAPSEAEQTSHYPSIASLIGTLHLGTTDLAENHDYYIGEALAQELNPIE